MVNVDYKEEVSSVTIPESLLKGKRHLTKSEIRVLQKNSNYNEDSSWRNVYVEAEDGFFDPKFIQHTAFSGYVILGKLRTAILSYNDLHLHAGIYSSNLNNCVIGDDCVIRNVAYMDNYHIGNRVILFNVQEICCTKHAKFGQGILKQGEPESHRIWIGVANENDGRAVLPFETMIPADAYIWSHYREDKELLARFKELTEYGNSGELNTFGWIDDDCVIKNSNILKDAKVGKATYIKGAFKLKNITIRSSEEEPSQIGEGVELVNGIVGFGCHIFYQAVGVRFVIGRNCQLKYGARVLNTVLGDNSTVSCCELLNNLIYPFHEQHHNSSFLIATTVMGQSNIAAGATIGSNHNSRSPDGEIFAKRGFWPGLCSDFKHNSRFASFVLVAKGSYENELDIQYPFALVTRSSANTSGMGGAINVIPAWWFMYDMFAISRNNNKFRKRDRRKRIIQRVETDPLAPDTMEECIYAIDRLIELTAEYLKKNEPEVFENCKDKKDELQCAKDYMHRNSDVDITLEDSRCQKKYGAIIHKPIQAYKMYRRIIKYYTVRTLMEFCNESAYESLNFEIIEKIRAIPLYTKWENVGGQIVPSEKIQELFAKIKNHEIEEWNEVHNFYNLCDAAYLLYKTRYSLYLLEFLYSCPIEEFSLDLYRNITDDVFVVACDMYNAAIKSREKDYTDYYRNMTYHSKEEMDNVIGPLEDNSFLKQMHEDTEHFTNSINHIFEGLIK
ncbi:MAG: DUF4954 family protein [Treponema sp.]|nr:DUF4954 family protein [Treponema sp.]